MDQMRADFRFAMRGFRRTPGFFVTAVAILGLGIGPSEAAPFWSGILKGLVKRGLKA